MVRAAHFIVLAAIAALLVLALGAGSGSATAADGDTNVTAYRASSVMLGDAGAIEAAIDDGRLESAERAVLGDTLIVVIDDGRLAATLNTSEGTPTERFFDALAGDADFRIIETNPSTMRPRIVAPVGPENTTVYRDGTRTYLRIDTGELSFRFRGSGNPDRAAIHGGERFALEFGYNLTAEPSRAREPPEPVVELYPTEDALPETATPTATPTVTRTATPTRTPTASATPTTSATPAATATESPTATPSTTSRSETRSPPPTTDETVPGFGPIALLVAVAVLFVAGSRRA